ncbi:hypothetical protein [Streptomyces candidus]|uniref:Uncharacterized protein n=1 Tax=Streptomyces candidus TaxID=67283 RepID=A0A7X0HEB5_9ACTN|nr:hypothetical protein [Streptomyces candidus]MBB6436044.1 hypothetical protein [Streptomyces candidus]GHH43452.1 hypothetical protein GCM10018773_29490 [Streptomyces candidus]
MTVILRLTGVYHADGGLIGELSYAARKLTGRGHCGLCDVTHRGVRAKPEWSAWVESLPVPFDLVHRNERSAEVRAASDALTPCVLAHTDEGLRLVLDRTALDRTGGDVDAYAAALTAGVRDAGLAWPTAPTGH